MVEHNIRIMDASYGIMRKNETDVIEPEDLVTEFIKMGLIHPEELPEALEWLVTQRKRQLGFSIEEGIHA
jgi:hypothetical protein